ncbi:MULTISPECIES: Aca2/YdiL-like domain-containing protein [Acinetobacter]|uniref:DUF1870 family protein n=1 Tax=Acinetobacter indicus TaxID=756892 RepID=A0A6C0Y7F4_9GAMM|nr:MULTISPECIES: DUF1870 family protein [Acinetobacter]QIC72066.1 DUF1870 family protein [Acinetobacter indicus]QKQ71533.1 DUF1870 family protein [Acinetobacter sp. 10FS3-1]
MNHLQLKAQRQGLGLTVAEIAEIAKVTKRSFQYWEAGKVPVPYDVEMLMDLMVSQYNLVLDLLLSDVELATWRNTDPDNNPNKPMRISPTLPFFHSFELFSERTGVKNIVYWRIYQSVVSQLIITGKIVRLSDDTKIPESWGIWKWFKGNYDTH